jgi:hypothetical protein
MTLNLYLKDYFDHILTVSAGSFGESECVAYDTWKSRGTNKFPKCFQNSQKSTEVWSIGAILRRRKNLYSGIDYELLL